MLAESMALRGAARALPVRGTPSAPSRAPASDQLERLLRALDALRQLAEQMVAEPQLVRTEARGALAQVADALDDYHVELEHALCARYSLSSPFSALLVEHVRSCAARQRLDVARLCAELERTETSMTRVLRAAWALALVTRIEVLQLARDVPL